MRLRLHGFTTEETENVIYMLSYHPDLITSWEQELSAPTKG